MEAKRFTRCIVPVDILHLAEPSVLDPFLEALARLQSDFDVIRFETVAPEGLAVWKWAFRVLQGREIWKTHGAWIEAVHPTFGPGIAERFAWTRKLTEEEERLARRLRASAIRRLKALLDENTVLFMPTAPGGAPKVGLDTATLEGWRSKLMQFTCIAGLGGLPEITIPSMVVDGLPVGFSVIAARDQDERMLKWVVKWSERLVLSHPPTGREGGRTN
ncbi:hypothetical protein GCM10010885_22540 [Alicyclobacillus cellulosilyticus]|uniref:Amidase domain-containing protein n=2 Tax=Alicyclobacillus cellulosilyticus TaxID=1003997 RepID=A0A917KG93_9BACL|nr:hypothetical protein GCM10010885_22540 [Alicyclobacillus cellulosilyticus]